MAKRARESWEKPIGSPLGMWAARNMGSFHSDPGSSKRKIRKKLKKIEKKIRKKILMQGETAHFKACEGNTASYQYSAKKIPCFLGSSVPGISDEEGSMGDFLNSTPLANQ
jgi:hypothetical protein